MYLYKTTKLLVYSDYRDCSDCSVALLLAANGKWPDGWRQTAGLHWVQNLRRCIEKDLM